MSILSQSCESRSPFSASNRHSECDLLSVVYSVFCVSSQRHAERQRAGQFQQGFEPLERSEISRMRCKLRGNFLDTLPNGELDRSFRESASRALCKFRSLFSSPVLDEAKVLVNHGLLGIGVSGARPQPASRLVPLVAGFGLKATRVWLAHCIGFQKHAIRSGSCSITHISGPRGCVG